MNIVINLNPTGGWDGCNVCPIEGHFSLDVSMHVFEHMEMYTVCLYICDMHVRVGMYVISRGCQEGRG